MPPVVITGLAARRARAVSVTADPCLRPQSWNLKQAQGAGHPSKWRPAGNEQVGSGELGLPQGLDSPSKSEVVAARKTFLPRELSSHNHGDQATAALLTAASDLRTQGARECVLA